MLFNPRLLGGLAVLLPALAGALGLGEAHVSSHLNQPLSATIEVLSVGPNDLKDLTATLASREVYERQGIERSAFLSNLSFKVTRSADGQAQVEVHSSQPVTEPFLTFLVAIDWPRGHLVREYTLMLDPPVFETKPSAPLAVQAPATGVSETASGAVPRTATESAASAAPATVEHTVVAGETLSSVVRAQGYSSAADVNRALIATFRANPAAFDGNINRLRRGAILRIPPSSEWSRLAVDEATAEVHRQVGDWKSWQQAPHLRLIVPKTPAEPAAAATPAAPSPGVPSSDKSSVAEMRRLLELKNAELARLQQQLAQKNVAAPATAPTPQAAPTAPVAAPAPSPSAETPTATPAPTPPVVVPAPRKHTSTPPPPEPSFFDGLLDNLPRLVGGALALLIAALVLIKLRARRREADAADGSAAPTPELGSEFPLGGWQQTATALSAAGDAPARLGSEASSLGDETADFQPPPFNSLTTQAIPHSATPGSPPLDSRLGAESSITLHHMDPLAEADFHIAYGLYSQAADILRLAIDLDPSRSDLKLKLLEVHFVAGDAAAFMGVARGLNKSAFEPADWSRVQVMGRQMAPDEPLFAGRVEGSAGMDLDLGGEDLAAATEFDVELTDGDTFVPVPAPEPESESESDAFSRDELLELEKDLLELSATYEPSALVGEATAVAAGASVDSPATTTEVALEDFGLPEDLLKDLPQEPPARSDTVLTPHLEEPTRLMRGLPDAAASGAPAAQDEDSPQALLAEATRLMASLWPESKAPIDPSQSATVAIPEPAVFQGGMQAEDITLTAEESASELETASVPVVKIAPASTALPSSDTPLAGLKLDDLNLGDEPLEFDLDDLARALQDDTLAQPGPDRSKFQTDLLATGLHVVSPPVHAGDDAFPQDDEVSRARNSDLDLPDLDAVTLSEVGTKLDLARAYLDMGDPDGARAILEEVLSEGSPSQKVEAQRLVETLPG